jgi:hypothetical protein
MSIARTATASAGRRPARAVGLLAGALVGILACAGPSDGPGEIPGNGGVGSAPAPGALPDRPTEQVMRIEIEGYPEELRFVLFRTGEGFALPFSTYVPVDMAAEADRWEALEGVRFVAVFGGQRNESAALRVIVHHAGATESDAVAVLRGLAADLGTELVDAPWEDSFEWSVRDFRNVAEPFRADAVEGVMALGIRGGRYFAVVIHYPAEYGDGFGPRAEQILREWRWEDTGEALWAPEGSPNGWQ